MRKFAIAFAVLIFTALVFAGPSIISVYQGGTGATSLTAHGVVIGQGTSAVHVTSAGTSNQCLLSGGSSADPSFQACPTPIISGPTYGTQYCTNFTTGASSAFSCTSGTGSSVAANDVMIVTCSAFTNDGGTITFSMSDSKTSSWTQILTYYSTTAGFRISAWWAKAASSGSDTFTCTPSSSTSFFVVTAQQCSGCSATSPVDATVTNQGTGSGMVSGLLTTTSTNDLMFIVAGTGGNDGGAVTIGGFTAFSSSSIGAYVGFKSAGGTGTYAVNVINANATWGNIAFALH